MTNITYTLHYIHYRYTTYITYALHTLHLHYIHNKYILHITYTWHAFQLHGKRRIERRLFFQPLQVHCPCVFSGFSACVHFLDPLKSCDKLLRFINVVSVSVFLSITNYAGRELNFDTLQLREGKRSKTTRPLKSSWIPSL